MYADKHLPGWLQPGRFQGDLHAQGRPLKGPLDPVRLDDEVE